MFFLFFQNHLLKTQEIIKRLTGQIFTSQSSICVSNSVTPTPATSSAGPFSKLEAKMSLLIEQTPTTDRTTKQKLENLCNAERMSFESNILEHWQNTRYKDPELGNLIDVTLSVPSTQVSVERAFSALSIILTKLRSKLSKETINNLLIVKLNNNLIKDVIVTEEMCN